MIYPLPNESLIHYVVVRERPGDLVDFLDRICEIITKYQTGVFKSESGKFFRARLIKRLDHIETKLSHEFFERQEITYTISAIRKVTFKYVFELYFQV